MTTKTAFQEYRFARIEGRAIARAKLQAQFAAGALSLSQFEAVIEQYLNTDPVTVIPWRTSEHERVGCSDGVQMAALEFYWEHRNDFSDRVPELIAAATKIASC